MLNNFLRIFSILTLAFFALLIGQYSFQDGFINSAISAIIFCEDYLYLTCIYFKNSLNNLASLANNISIFFIAITASIIILFHAPILEELKKQKLHKQKSYIFYATILLGISIIILPSNQLLCFATLIICIFLYKKFLPELDPKKLPRRFSDSTCEEDEFGFKTKAKKDAEELYGIFTEKNFVKVVAINGGIGCGKSSYLKFIIEYLFEKKSKEILYTYISLSEAGDKKNFLRLFAERFYKTLNERYPRINFLSHLSEINSIFKKDLGFLGKIMSLLQIFDLGLLPTRNCPKKVAQIFGHIPEIKEKIWIIAIEEFERSLAKEILQIKEIIDNFKNECQFGFPIKILFLISIDKEKLQENLKDCGQEGAIIKDYFIDDPKGIDLNILLPSPNIKQRNKFIEDAFNKVIKKYDFEKEVRIEDCHNNTHNIIDSGNALTAVADENDKKIKMLCNYYNPERPYDPKYLRYDSPRIIKKLSLELDFFLSIANNAAKEANLDLKDFVRVKIEEIILLQYIKLTDIRQFKLLSKYADEFCFDGAKQYNNEAFKKRPEYSELKIKDEKSLFGFLNEITGADKNLDSHNSISNPYNLKLLLTLENDDESRDNLVRIARISNKEEGDFKKEIEEDLERNICIDPRALYIKNFKDLESYINFIANKPEHRLIFAETLFKVANEKFTNFEKNKNTKITQEVNNEIAKQKDLLTYLFLLFLKDSSAINIKGLDETKKLAQEFKKLHENNDEINKFCKALDKLIAFNEKNSFSNEDCKKIIDYFVYDPFKDINPSLTLNNALCLLNDKALNALVDGEYLYNEASGLQKALSRKETLQRLSTNQLNKMIERLKTNQA